MNGHKNEVRKEFSSVMHEYSQLFAERGVQCSYQIRQFRQVMPDSRPLRARQTQALLAAVGRWFKELFTGKEIPKKDYNTYEICALIIHFSAPGKSRKNTPGRDYAFTFRCDSWHGLQTIPTKRVVRSAERLLRRKLRFLERKPPQVLYTESWTDVLRYTFGNYGYKNSVKGIPISFLYLGVVLLIALIEIVVTFFVQ